MSFFVPFSRYRKNIDSFISAHFNPESSKAFRAIRSKMIFAKAFYGLNYSDFYQCRCEQMSYTQISQIVPYSEQKALWLRVSSPASRSTLFNKIKTYLYFKDYYQRDVLFVSGRESTEEFRLFCRAHTRFIVKPLGMNCGKGVRIFDASKVLFQVESIIDGYPEGFVAEEIIKQDVSLSRLHPESVNTLRINTVNYGTSVDIKWPCLRIGRGKSIVDNAGAGGVFGAIDTKTGLITDVSDEFHHTFLEHPDTKIPLIGFKVPKWQEACEMAKHLANLIPDCHFVGWDFALTDKGWVMVEGNHSPLLIWQIATGKGIRKEFSQMRKRLLRG